MTPTTRPTPTVSASVLREAVPRPAMRQPLAQRGAGKRARQHADQGDADLHRGKEFAGIGCQRQRAPRAADAFLDQRREPRRPGRDDRQFRHRQQAVDDDQDRDDRKFQI